MAFSLSALVDGDNWKGKINAAFVKIAAYLNAIPGSALSAGTVATSKLEKPKGLYEINLLQCQGSGGLAATTRANVDAATLTDIDGASNSSRRIVGWSFHCGNSATALAKVAGSQLLVKVAAATVITIDLNDATLAVGTPIFAAIAAVSMTSGQKVTVDYTAGGGGAVYPCPHLVLYCSITHVGT